MSNTRVNAFDSPNCPPLLEAKTGLDLDLKMLIHPPGHASFPDEFRLYDKLCTNVYVLKVTPTISPKIIGAICQPPMEGEYAFGSLLHVISEADHNIIAGIQK